MKWPPQHGTTTPQGPTDQRRNGKLVTFGKLSEVAGWVLKVDIQHKIIKTENRFPVTTGEIERVGARQEARKAQGGHVRVATMLVIVRMPV